MRSVQNAFYSNRNFTLAFSTLNCESLRRSLHEIYRLHAETIDKKAKTTRKLRTEQNRFRVLENSIRGTEERQRLAQLHGRSAHYYRRHVYDEQSALSVSRVV